MFIGILCLVIAILAFVLRNTIPNQRGIMTMASTLTAVLGIGALLFSAFTIISASSAGVIRVFGAVKETTLAEGGHFVPPWYTITQVYLGQQVGQVKASEASSKDLQSVHSDLVVNYTVADPLRLYKLNTSLNYAMLLVEPAIQEVFKDVVSRYTAEELVTHRSEVSTAITTALSKKLSPFFLSVQAVNLTNFGFSKSFNDSIEEKVTASQKAATAQRNLERVEFEAQARVAAATGEAKAIAIQAAAIQNQGGIAYTQLKAIEKWDGKLPQYMTSGAVTPFVAVK